MNQFFFLIEMIWAQYFQEPLKDEFVFYHQELNIIASLFLYYYNKVMST